MRAVIQRVTRAAVMVDARIEGQIGAGLLVLLGVAKGDEDRDVQYMVEKIATLRIFGDPEGKLNLSIGEAGGALLIVSQFTLLGDTGKG
ncbi:MAG: D-aminoacyl-tRNA deacylase, partial [Terriglobales bacterium]